MNQYPSCTKCKYCRNYIIKDERKLAFCILDQDYILDNTDVKCVDFKLVINIQNIIKKEKLNMINIPKEVKVGGLYYSVEETSAPILVNDQLCYGCIEYGNEVIKLSTSLQSERIKQQTFLHELFHSLCRNSNMDFEDEEYVVDTFSKGLYQVICDNPEIFTNLEYAMEVLNKEMVGSEKNK